MTKLHEVYKNYELFAGKEVELGGNREKFRKLHKLQRGLRFGARRKVKLLQEYYNQEKYDHVELYSTPTSYVVVYSSYNPEPHEGFTITEPLYSSNCRSYYKVVPKST